MAGRKKASWWRRIAGSVFDFVQLVGVTGLCTLARLLPCCFCHATMTRLDRLMCFEDLREV